MGGSCGFCGQMFIVYALYLSLINAVLMSPVTDTSEQQHGLTQCADDLLPTFKALEGSKTLPPACLFESEQEDRCSRKTHRKTKDFPQLLNCSSFFGNSTCFQHVHQSNMQFKDLLFRITNCCTFSTDEGLGPTWRPVTEVTARSL